MKSPIAKRLLFRIYDREDRDLFLDLVTNRNIMRFVDRGALDRRQALTLWRKLINEFYPAGNETIYAVFSKSERRYVGHAAIRPRPERKQDWEISYMLISDAWGNGFATEIAKSLVDFGFDELLLNEVFATIAAENTASISVAQKAGMSLIATESEAPAETLVFSIKARY
jgi:ribosomal-protein-alanine N-acetyltransferase